MSSSPSICLPHDAPHPDRLTISPESPAAEAARMIAAQRVGAVAVQDREGRVVGLVSEADIVRVVATRSQGLRGLAVEDVMSPRPVTVSLATPADLAIDIMRRFALRHLPVCGEDGRLLGLIGLGDLARPA
jgi:CBS domain-containing protein